MRGSNKIDYSYLEYVMVNYINYDRNAVYEMTLGEILDIIAHHHKSMDEQNRKLNSDNKQQKQENTQGVTETYCVDPETLARWAREEEMG